MSVWYLITMLLSVFFFPSAGRSRISQPYIALALLMILAAAYHTLLPSGNGVQAWYRLSDEISEKLSEDGTGRGASGD